MLRTDTRKSFTEQMSDGTYYTKETKNGNNSGTTLLEKMMESFDYTYLE